MKDSSTKTAGGGWLVIGAVFVASLVLCLVATRGPFLMALGRALGLVAFPALAFAICGAVCKALLKRPMGRLGSLASFLGTWVLLTTPVAIEAFSKEIVTDVGKRVVYGLVAVTAMWFAIIRPWRNRTRRPKPSESADPDIEAWKAERARRFGAPATVHPKLDSPMPATAPASFFDLEIPEAHMRSLGVYEIAHAKPYTIVLSNQHPNFCCDAKVWVDGKEVGTWRIERASRIRLERPVNDTGRFTFFRIGTPESRQAGLDPANPALGLIRVKFMPEAPRPPLRPEDPRDPIMPDVPRDPLMPEAPRDRHFLASSPGSLENGGTGLSGHSEQTFGSAAGIRHDEFGEVMREIRLIPRPDIRPLRPVA